MPDSLPDLIRQRAEGNPLFVEEFVYMLMDNGIIEQDAQEHWRINRFQYSMRSSALPDGLLALLQTRLDELPPTARQVIQIAATAGTSFWPAAMVGLVDEAELKGALDTLEARGMILPQVESDFENLAAHRFRHTLYRDVVYSMLTRQHRAHYHRHLARWLAEQVDAHPDYLDILAEHYLAGGQNAESLRAYHVATLDRFRRGMMTETLAMIEKGLNAARDVPREIALPIVSHLWVIQARTFNALNRFEEASAASQTALMLLDELPADSMFDEKATAARTLGHAQASLGRYSEAFDALNRANSLLPRENKAEHAAILRTFGRLFQMRGQLNESLAYQQEAFASAQESGDEREVSRVMSLLGTIALDRGDFATALAYCEQVLQRNQREGNTYYQILDMRQLVRIYYSLFAYDDALAICEEAESLQVRIHYHDPLLQAFRALCWIESGEVEQGMSLISTLVQAEYQNAETRNKIRLAMLMALAAVEDYAACYRNSTALLHSGIEDNQLLHGRALIWQGMAMNALAYPEARPTLEAALDKELTYGGRYAWRCYYALGAASESEDERLTWYGMALSTLQATASSLHTRPHLQAILRQNTRMQWLLDQVPEAQQE